MIGEILQAVIDECTEFYKDKGGSFILRTDFQATNLPSYSMPLCLFDLIDAEESGQFIGGVTRMDWRFGINSYNLQPNTTNEPDGGYSTGLLNVIDDIRCHFSKGIFLTQGMADILENYGFRFTLSGIMTADALDEAGLVMGYKIIFDSISIDTNTDPIEQSTQVLEHVVQVDNPPFN